MKSKIYYGEYSLMHWIKLMLSKNIELPEYQRHFVWQERDVKRLIQSLLEGQFVQPVTIALFDEGGSKRNLILDGQQRLTSILLAYLGYFPNKNKFIIKTDGFASEDDSTLDDRDSTSQEHPMLWKYPLLLDKGTTKNEILNNLGRDINYIKLSEKIFTDLTDNFFNNTYLGFSYVVPQSTDTTAIQKCFSQLFRNINYFGKKLEARESRKSLYYQNTNLTMFFDGKCQDGSDVLSDLNILEDFQPCRIDFVRYLSILSQFYSSSRTDAKDIMLGYSSYSSRESFYADYVSYILNIEQEDRVNKFDRFSFESTFPAECWKQRYETLRDSLIKIKPLMRLKDGKSFSAWYEADYWLFGLMFHILFKGKTLKEELTRFNNAKKHISLKDEMESRIRKDKRDSLFTKNSNRLGYLRERLKDSCQIISYYVQ